jgi:uncharacterized membrane protein
MSPISVTTLVAALGCALIGGVFFAFSTFVMRALSRLPSVQGVRAMQSINVVVINPKFMGAFLGTAAVCVVLTVMAMTTWRAPGSALRLAGGLLYVLGTVGATIAFNVPRNEALANIEPDSAEAEKHWVRFVREWTVWNHVRTAAAIAAAALLMAALVVDAAP